MVQDWWTPEEESPLIKHISLLLALTLTFFHPQLLTGLKSLYNLPSKNIPRPTD